MAGPWEDYAAPTGPSPRERATAASTASTEASAARTRGLTPAEIRKAEGEARLVEYNVEKAKSEEADRQRKSQDAAAAESSVVAGLARTIAAAAAAKGKSRDEWFATGFGAETAADLGATEAANVAGLLKTIGSKTAIDTLSELKAAGTALTPVSNTDIELMRTSLADLSQSQTDEEFQRSMNVVMDAFLPIYKRLGGTPDLLQTSYKMRTGNPLPADAIPGFEPKRPAPRAGEAPATAQEATTELRAGAGDKYVSEEDKRIAARLQQAFDAGASQAEMNALAQELGRPVPQDQLDAAIRYRDAGGKGAQIVPGESTRPVSEQIIGAVGESPVGAYAIGAGSALTGGMTDELAGLMGGPEAEERARFARQYSQTESPIASTLGEIAGGMMASIPAVRGAQMLAPGLSATRAAMLGETALGAITGAGEAAPGSRITGAAMGAGLGLAGGAVPGATARVLSPRTPESVRMLREAGVRDMSLGQTLGAPELEAGLAGVLPGGGDVALRAQRQAFEQFQEAYLDDALRNIGVEVPKGLKPTKRMEVAQKAFNDAYEAARSQMQMVPDAPLRNDLMAFRQRLDSDEFSEEAASRLRKLLEGTVQRKIDTPAGQGISGDKYKSLVSLLGKRRAAFSKQQNAEMADGVAELQRILDDNARRHSPPEAVDLMDRADRGYAILTRAEEAARNLGNAPGEFTPQQALAAARKGDTSARSRAFVRGEARGQRLAEAGIEALGKAPPGDVSRVERGIGLTSSVAGAPLSLPINIAMGLGNAPGVRQALGTAIAGQRPAAAMRAADIIRDRPEYLAALATAPMLQGVRDRPEDIEDLRARYGIGAPSEFQFDPMFYGGQ
jgi:hypothetical protein